MKLKIIALCFLAAGFVVKPAHSTHIIGGEIYYECLNPAIGSYRFTVKLYRDCYSGVPPFDDPIFVSIYDNNDSLIAKMDMDLPLVTELENNTYNFCFYAPPNVCIEEAIYSEVQILPPGTYHFTYQRCCRNQGILNITNPQGQGFGFDMLVPDTILAVCNSSPYYNNYPPTIICLDAPFTYDHSAVDADGDSLVYRLCPAIEYEDTIWGISPNPSGPPSSNYAVTYELPYDSLYPIWAPVDSFKIDPVTGLMTGTPTQMGRYVMAVCVSEYRNGVLLSTNSRDFQFNVAACLDDPLLQFNWIPDSINPCIINFTYAGNEVGSHDWNFGVDSLISDTSGLENPSYTFPGSGIYTVTLIGNKDYSCVDTLEVEIDINNCPLVSIPESGGKNKNNLYIYPNPANGRFKVAIKGYDHKGKLQLDVFHIDGRHIFKKVVSTSTIDKPYIIDMEGVSKGIYFLKVETGQGILTKRLIIF